MWAAVSSPCRPAWCRSWQRASIVALLVQAALWADALLDFAVARSADGRKEADPASATTLGALGFLGRLAIWTAAVLLVMANLGINVTALVAGFGIGGVAVALAAQNILGDLFASASIVLDKPFVLGDFIVVDDKSGTVEHIGLKTTRLRSLSGEQLIFSNADLLKSRIHNYQRMSERRAALSINVAYGTPYEKLAAIPAMLREAVESQPQARFDRAHFARLGPSAHGVRGGLLRDRGRLQRLHGRAAGGQSGGGPPLRPRGRRVCQVTM